jgi:hypothetical protein
VSEHLILACVFEAIMCRAEYGASASWLEASVLDKIIEHIPPLASNGWHWCESTRFYAKNGAFMFTMSNGDIAGRMGYSVWLGAKTEQPLQFLKPLLDKHWDFVAV